MIISEKGQALPLAMMALAFALNRMAVGDFRHIPIEQDERPVGIISVRDVLGYLAGKFPEILDANE